MILCRFGLCRRCDIRRTTVIDKYIWKFSLLSTLHLTQETCVYTWGHGISHNVDNWLQKNPWHTCQAPMQFPQTWPQWWNWYWEWTEAQYCVKEIYICYRCIVQLDMAAKTSKLVPHSLIRLMWCGVKLFGGLPDFPGRPGVFYFLAWPGMKMLTLNTETCWQSFSHVILPKAHGQFHCHESTS